MNHYEIKQQLKKERFEKLAASLHSRADAAYESGMTALRAIPFGQPILVGHHSERSDRAYRGRAIGKIDKSFEMAKSAERYERKAESIGNGGISSDDPDAVRKLKEKLAGQVEYHEKMKQANTDARKNGTAKPAPAWMLSNSNARMNATKERIKGLEAKAGMQAREPIAGAGFVVKEDIEDNRIMILFQGKPIESTRSILKARGFRWSHTRSAWVRQLNNAGRYAADQIVNAIK